jgi:uncharacterized protein
MDNNALIIFAKNPVKGRVKTRLAKFIGNTEALRYYKSLLQFTSEQTKNLYCRKFLFLTDNIDTGLFDSSCTCLLQQGSDLGERMKSAFAYVFSMGFNKVCIIGTDAPGLDSETISKAFKMLGDNDYVIGPSKDGGYYLLGMKAASDELFENISWSTDEVLNQTIAKINPAGKKYYLLEELCDVDTIEDFIECTGFEQGTASKNGLRFAVKLHDSLKRHYDFRLEWNGVLLSWYSDKPPCMNPDESALMTITALHKIKYMYSEENRPYFLKGPGPSIVVDKGYYTPRFNRIPVSSIKEASEIIKKGIQAGLLEIYLEGVNLKGTFSLIRTGKGDNWMLQKLEDEFVSDFSLSEISSSVISGRTLDDVKNGVKSSVKDINQESLF